MNQHHLMPNPNFAIAYTDGACRGNGKDNAKGGYGAVIILPNGEQMDICGGENGTTNNKMELLGAIVALENSPNTLPIQIWTDSGYVKDGITKWLAGWKKNGWKTAKKDPVKNQDLWQRLDLACQNRQIDWQWVKGHAGHDGNEYADQLANRGIDNLPKVFEKVVKNQMFDKNSLSLNPMTQNFTQNTFSENPANQDFNPNYPPDFNEGFYQDDSFDDEFVENEDIFMQVLDKNSANSQALNPQSLNQQKGVENNVENNSPTFSPVADFSAFVDNQGNFVAQDEVLIAQRPQFDGNTTQPNPTFVPLLPLAKNVGVSNRQLILDTETTGFEALNGDRIIEVGVVELINRKFTGEKLHVYINPHKMMDEEVIKIHGIHNAFLDGMPNFEQIGKPLYDFLQGAELIAHNANFDMSFLQAEFNRMGLPDILPQVTVTDSLAMAKQLYAGQRNTLDALVRRLDVGKQDRTFHGALLDAEILAEVYLAMTGGQVSLAIDDGGSMGADGNSEHIRFDSPVMRAVANRETESAHLAWLESLTGKYPQLAQNWGITADND